MQMGGEFRQQLIKKIVFLTPTLPGHQEKEDCNLSEKRPGKSFFKEIKAVGV